MNKQDSYFLSYAFGVHRHQLVQYGILLDLSNPRAPAMGIYEKDVHLDWIERLKGAFKREKFADECEDRFETSVPFKVDPELRGLVQSVWPEFDDEIIIQPSAASIYDRTRAHDLALQMIKPAVQIPVISYLHEKELIRISQRIQVLESDKENRIIKGLYEFNQLSKYVLEAWFVENELEVPSIGLPEAQDEGEGEPFRLDEETGRAFKGGEEYPLTPNQFRVVSFLNEALMQEEDGWKKWEAIKKHTKVEASKMYEVFRDNQPAWNHLIDHPSGKRKYRLKV